MQKLVTIYLNDGSEGYHHRSEIDHGKVEEHLHDYLQGGWKISTISSVGSVGQGYHGKGWIIVLLEK